MTDGGGEMAVVALDAEGRPVEVLKRNVELWRDIDASTVGARMKRALLRVAAGELIRCAAEAEGYAGPQDLWRYSRRFGLVGTKTKAIIDGQRTLAVLAGQELQQRLESKPKDVSTRDLAVIGGIAADKVLAHEKVGTTDGGGYLSALDRLALTVAETGRGVSIGVTVTPLEGEGVTDVTVLDTADPSENQPALPPPAAVTDPDEGESPT